VSRTKNVNNNNGDAFTCMAGHTLAVCRLQRGDCANCNVIHVCWLTLSHQRQHSKACVTVDY
jgi:hypothetical protein